MVEGELTMTESAGICQYLVDRHGPTDIGLTPKDKDYGLYLNWLHRSDATLTFPQTIVLRYTVLEPEERRLKQAVDEYTQWFFSRLKSVEIGRADVCTPVTNAQHECWLQLNNKKQPLTHIA